MKYKKIRRYFYIFDKLYILRNQKRKKINHMKKLRKVLPGSPWSVMVLRPGSEP